MVGKVGCPAPLECHSTKRDKSIFLTLRHSNLSGYFARALPALLVLRATKLVTDMQP